MCTDLISSIYPTLICIHQINPWAHLLQDPMPQYLFIGKFIHVQNPLLQPFLLCQICTHVKKKTRAYYLELELKYGESLLKFIFRNWRSLQLHIFRSFTFWTGSRKMRLFNAKSFLGCLQFMQAQKFIYLYFKKTLPFTYWSTGNNNNNNNYYYYYYYWSTTADQTDKPSAPQVKLSSWGRQILFIFWKNSQDKLDVYHAFSSLPPPPPTSVIHSACVVFFFQL